MNLLILQIHFGNIAFDAAGPQSLERYAVLPQTNGFGLQPF